MASPDDTNPTGDDADMDHADLQAALGDLLSGGGDAVRSPSGEPADLGSDELDLSMLEDAVAELGIDVNDEDDEEPGSPREINLGTDADDVPAKRNMGLDLTELPPPPGAPAAAADKPAKKLPPLGQASAADLFGEEDDDWDDGDLGVADFPAAKDHGPADPLPPVDPPAVEDHDADAGADAAPVQLPAPDVPRADPATDEVIAFAAHKGRLSGEIASKAKKFFGR